MIPHVLIGSKAISNAFDGTDYGFDRYKEKSDVDVLLREWPENKFRARQFFKDFYETLKVDLHVIPPLWTAIEDAVDSSRNILFTLKASHLTYDPPRTEPKTVYDLINMSKLGCKINNRLFIQLYYHWMKQFGRKWRADFTEEADSFFDNAINTDIDHDFLHETFKKYDQPAFRYVQEPGQTTVWVDPFKFTKVGVEKRNAVIIEEAQVLAIERFHMQGSEVNQHIAFRKMIVALVKRLAPLWMVPYILNNFHYFMIYQEDYYSKLNKVENELSTI